MGLFGGGNSSSSNTNQTENIDNRAVITNTTSSYDLSDHSVTNVTDGGAIQGITNVAALALNNSTAQSLAGYQFADHIFDTATVFANNAMNSASDAFSQAAVMEKDALTGAKQAYADANKSVVTAYGSAQDATLKAYTAAQASSQQAQAATAAAYADAKGTTDSQKQIILGVLAVAAVMAFAMMKRG
jgi:hypothetical protein